MNALDSILAEQKGLVVAFSGGVDSSVLLAEALRVLGPTRVVAALADSASLARSERATARRVASSLGAELIEFATEEMNDPRYRANAGDRCYWCKEALFVAAGKLAAARGWALAFGETADDVGEHRPGARSASERGVLAPLRAAGWNKAAVRARARELGLEVAEKPAAPCLASRLPVGVAVDAATLGRVEALEAALHARGYSIVRARHYDAESVVLEFASSDLARAEAESAALTALATECGYRSIQMRAYRSGAVSV